MFDLENSVDIEGVSKDQSLEGFSSLSEYEKSYIEEVLPLKDPELIVARIDEISGYVPPRAIDHNPDIARVIELEKPNIDKQYLEAPSDLEQMDECLEMLQEHEITNPEKWNAASIEEKVEMLQDAEVRLAEIEHRPPVPIYVSDQMGRVVKRGDVIYGRFGGYDSGTKDITLNLDLLHSKDVSFQEKVVNTLIHEGRHAYQDYNSHERTVHVDLGVVTDWEHNMSQGNYKACPPYDFETYRYQPVEMDAHDFADPITDELFQRV